MDVIAEASLLKAAEVPAKINVILQKKAQEQTEAVLANLLPKPEDTARLREFQATGKGLNVVA